MTGGVIDGPLEISASLHVNGPSANHAGRVGSAPALPSLVTSNFEKIVQSRLRVRIDCVPPTSLRFLRSLEKTRK